MFRDLLELRETLEEFKIIKSYVIGFNQSYHLYETYMNESIKELDDMLVNLISAESP